MSGPVGHTFIYNIVIIFVIVVFAFISGTLSYYKAFKVNNRIVKAVEKYEGYNDYSKKEIDRVLGNLGYSVEDANCKQTYNGMILIDSFNENYRYCIYIDNKKPPKNGHYIYGVLTYMNLDLPLVDIINFPVFTKTNRMFKFTSKESK